LGSFISLGFNGLTAELSKSRGRRRIFTLLECMNTSLQSGRASAANLNLEALLTEREYAGITQRSVASVRRDRLLKQGCPYVKLGALVRYRPEDVRAHLESNLRGPNAAQHRPYEAL
jgi:hypothetical protein